MAKRSSKKVEQSGRQVLDAGIQKEEPQLTLSNVRRPVEKERAAKTQPEVVLMHFRLTAHAYALCQIQRAIGKGVVVPGWVLPSGEGVE